MRKAFTLVELLIVVVVIVTLMAITFRLASIGSDTSARSKTINKLQRIENCLSGYYAAYGSYPPVQLHGSRDYTLSVNNQGIQQVGADPSSAQHESELSWRSVEAACRSQPVAMQYPFTSDEMADYVRSVSNIQRNRANSNDPKYEKYRNNPALKEGYVALIDDGPVGSWGSTHSEWKDVQVYKFGVLSYLLPRYLVMLNVSRSGSSSGVKDLCSDQLQWSNNNKLPCDFSTGAPYGSWNDVISDMQNERWKIAALPSQSVCARWMQNLEGIVSTQFGATLFGVSIRDGDSSSSFGVTVENANPPIYTGGNSQTGKDKSGDGTSYVLDGMTLHDGWGHEFYYYSPAPHQSYTLWSAGPNGKTFPPWIAGEEMKQKLTSEEFDTVQTWIADDIVNMRN